MYLIMSVIKQWFLLLINDLGYYDSSLGFLGKYNLFKLMLYENKIIWYDLIEYKVMKICNFKFYYLIGKIEIEFKRNVRLGFCFLGVLSLIEMLRQ